MSPIRFEKPGCKGDAIRAQQVLRGPSDGYLEPIGSIWFATCSHNSVRRLHVFIFWFVLGVAAPAIARADVALFLEEPYGTFGGMNPTGHASVYLSRVCAASPISLRRCEPGEQGVVISRYHRVGGYDWLAIPLIPYLYAVDKADEVPDRVNAEQVASLRDDYRRRHLEKIVPDDPDDSIPKGDWIQLIGASYDRTIYSFEIETSEEQDNQLIEAFNEGPNKNHFNLFFSNCSDFVRHVIDFYYPKAIHRNFTADVGIMTPKQAAKCLVKYAKQHPELQFSSFAIGQVSGTVPRSSAVRGVLESLVKSKRYVVPLTSLAVIQPYLGGGLIYAWAGSGRFNPRRLTQDSDAEAPPETFSEELESNHVARPSYVMGYLGSR